MHTQICFDYYRYKSFLLYSVVNNAIALKGFSVLNIPVCKKHPHKLHLHLLKLSLSLYLKQYIQIPSKILN